MKFALITELGMLVTALAASPATARVAADRLPGRAADPYYKAFAKKKVRRARGSSRR